MINTQDLVIDKRSSRSCPKCGGKVKDTEISAGSNDQGYITSLKTECVGGQHKEGPGCGYLTVYFHKAEIEVKPLGETLR